MVLAGSRYKGLDEMRTGSTISGENIRGELT